MRTLGSYPPGCANGGYQNGYVAVLKCPSCLSQWIHPCFYELDGWFLENDGDCICPNGCEIEPEWMDTQDAPKRPRAEELSDYVFETANCSKDPNVPPYMYSLNVDPQRRRLSSTD